MYNDKVCFSRYAVCFTITTFKRIIYLLFAVCTFVHFAYCTLCLMLLYFCLPITTRFPVTCVLHCNTSYFKLWVTNRMWDVLFYIVNALTTQPFMHRRRNAREKGKMVLKKQPLKQVRVLPMILPMTRRRWRVLVLADCSPLFCLTALLSDSDCEHCTIASFHLFCGDV